jgi:DNA-binding NarL/FixJ family response regulator
MEKSKSIKVCVVEDNKDIREELLNCLQEFDELEVIGAFDSGDAFIKTFDSIEPDVVLMDINMPGTNGIQCIKKLKPIKSSVQYLVCTVFEDHNHIYEALAAGANGYILKGSDVEKLYAAIREISSGGIPMSAAVARLVVGAFQKVERKSVAGNFQLTVREQEVLELMSKGYRNKEIANELIVSIDTVKSHVKNIYEKLQVNTRYEAIDLLKNQRG